MAFSVVINARFWDDPRYLSLRSEVGEVKAIGYLVLAWKTGFAFWDHDKKLVPEKVWSTLKLPDLLFTTGFAEHQQGGIYVHGTKEHAEKYEQCRESGRLGGQSKHKKRHTANSNEINDSDLALADVSLERNSSDLLRSSFSSSYSKKKEEYLCTQPPKRGCGAITELCQGDSQIKELLYLVSVNLQTNWIKIYVSPEWIRTQLLHAIGWLEANPHKRPKKNFGRFLNYWLVNNWERHRKTLPSNPATPKTANFVSVEELEAQERAHAKQG